MGSGGADSRCSQSAHDKNVLALGEGSSRRAQGGRVKKKGARLGAPGAGG